MKRLLLSLTVLSSAAAFGEVAQSVTPAQIEMGSGKKEHRASCILMDACAISEVKNLNFSKAMQYGNLP